MRIESTDRRQQRWDDLKRATGYGHCSKALDTAADYYLRMAGGTTSIPDGQLEMLLEAADERGSLTLEEIAEILDCDELPIEAETSWTVGDLDE